MVVRYAMCGLSNRGIANFARPLLGTAASEQHLPGPRSDDFSAESKLVAILDSDVQRVQQFTETQLPGGHDDIPCYRPEAFDAMVEQTSPNVVLVASPDNTHVDYVLAALGHGLDVITEKPLTSTAVDAARILQAERSSAGTVRVAHNMRYTPRHRQIKRLILSGAIGRVTHATLDYHVDTSHGASYFLRWNRRRDISGGLSIHKSCHHIDLMNWLIDDLPETVFAFGALNYYGPNSPHRARDESGAFLPVDQERSVDPYYRSQLGSGTFPDDDARDRSGAFGLTYPAQYPAGRATYLYDDEIDIEDTYSALLKYRGGAALSYSIDFSSPWEGYTMGISGTHGRIEASYGHERDGRPRQGTDAITYYPLFGERQVHDVRSGGAGHDGADPLMRMDLFGTGSSESLELGLAADTMQGAYAVAGGEAIWRSTLSGMPVEVDALLARPS